MCLPVMINAKGTIKIIEKSWGSYSGQERLKTSKHKSLVDGFIGKAFMFKLLKC